MTNNMGKGTDRDRLVQWTEDIEQLALELPLRHKNLFFHLKKREFNKRIRDLIKNIEVLDSYMIFMDIAAIVASVRDAHTSVAVPATRLLPFEFYWFPEGIYIKDAAHDYSEAIDCKVTHLNGISMNEILSRLARVISHENESFLKALLPRYIPIIEVLYGLEIVDEFEQVELRLEKENGYIFDMLVKTCEVGQNIREQSMNPNVSEDCLPLYRRNKGKNFWSFFMEKDSTLYFNYSSCKDMPDSTVECFCKELLRFINEKAVSRLVIDLRNNLGGNSTLLEPFILELRKCKELNREGGIFVILGRETFSSALLNAYSLKHKTKAVFVGEASGGKPNCYGEVQYFDLKNSGLKIRYSTQYYKIIKDDNQPSFYPDVPIEISVQDYLEKRDPCMEYILGVKG